MTGKTYSSFRTRNCKERPFRIIKIGLTRDREELYDRINRRVDIMMQEGLLEEARSVYPYKDLNSLNTVGYKEIFKYLDGEWTLDFAIEKIKQNSRIYSRKQMTWFKRDADIAWFHPDQQEEIMEHIKNNYHEKLLILLLMCMTLIPASGKNHKNAGIIINTPCLSISDFTPNWAVCGKANLSLADIVNRYSLLPVSSVTGMVIRHSGSTLLSFMPIPSLPWLKSRNAFYHLHNQAP